MASQVGLPDHGGGGEGGEEEQEEQWRQDEGGQRRALEETEVLLLLLAIKFHLILTIDLIPNLLYFYFCLKGGRR